MSATSKNKDVLRLEGTRIDYYENGNKKQESNYVDNQLSGKQISWYENNVKKSEKEMVWDAKNKTTETNVIAFWNSEGKQTVIDGNGQVEETDDEIYEKGEIKNAKKEGIWEGKHLKEKYSFTEIYKNGVFVSGISADENNNKYPYKELIEKANPSKGMDDFYRHIGRNYRTPNVQGLRGKIYLTFVVDKDGSLTNFRVLRDLGYGTGQEGIKAVSSYGKWTPGKMRGVPVKVLYSIPISIQTAEVNNQTQPFQTGANTIKNTNPNW
ncbi:energy transducer TonB [Flavobacterium sp. BBQ-18]|nr:energy transducer TonB [Flavobacterium undicola]